MRPGRIDRKIEYQLASQQQAHRLFIRFFPESTYPIAAISTVDKPAGAHEKHGGMEQLANEFASAIPPDEFSMAELQGYLLGFRTAPAEAVHGIQAWVEGERQARRDKEVREQLRTERIAAAKAQQQRSVYDPILAGVQRAVGPLPRPIPYNLGYGEPQPPGELHKDADAEPGHLGNTVKPTGVDQALRDSSDKTEDLNITHDTPLNPIDLSSVVA